MTLSKRVSSLSCLDGIQARYVEIFCWAVGASQPMSPQAEMFLALYTYSKCPIQEENDPFLLLRDLVPCLHL